MEGIDESGGYLVPDELDGRLVDVLEEENILRKLGHPLKTSGQHKINIVATKPAALWVEEGGALTFGDATFDQKFLDAHKLHVAVKITEELLYPRESAYMEIVAIYEALKRLKKYRTDGKIALFSDCMEVVNAFNSKLTGWHECGYKLKNVGRVKYWKLWKKIWKVSHKLPLRVQWVKGHARNGWNIRCDKTAKAEAKLRVG